MPEELPDFRPILAALNAAGVRFVVIGGLAMVGHGSNHITQDLDIGYSRDRANLQAIATALRTAAPRLRGFPADLPFIWDVQTIKGQTNMTLETDLATVDLLGDIPGIDSFQGLWQRSIPMEMFGFPIHVASLADLISMKRAAGRPKDIDHLHELETLKRLIEEEDSRA